jgi:hypothetical protein
LISSNQSAGAFPKQINPTPSAEQSFICEAI